MSETKRKVPKLRFPGFTEDWEQRKLGEVTSNIGDGLHGTPKYNESGEYYFINGNNLDGCKITIDNETKTVLEDQLSNDDKKLNDTSILMSINGTIGTLARYNGEKIMLGKSVAYINPSNIDRDYLYYYLQNSNVLKTFYKNLTGTTIKNLGLSVIKETLIMTSVEDEELKIGKFFKNFDNLITLHQRKLENLKLKKKALLQKLFPKNGGQFPELRFPGFTDAWEQRKLGELVEMISGDAPSMFTTGDNIYIKVDDLNYSDRVQISASNMVDINPKVHLVSKGATIFPKRGAAIMTNKVRIMGVDGYLDTNMMALIPNNIDKKFLFTFIQKTGLYKIADTSTIPQINNKHIEPYLIQVPSIKEQMYIGVIFEKLDNLITLHQRKLEHLQLQKKALLQQMFV